MEANLDDVAKGAGVAKGTLYRYFENKAELFSALAIAGASLETRRPGLILANGRTRPSHGPTVAPP